MNGDTPRPEPSPPHRVVRKDVDGHEFTAAFYPGFARSIRVNDVSVYDQKTDGPDPFVLPPGADRPFCSSAVQLASSKGYNVTLTIDDPEHAVDHIEVVLRTPAAGGDGSAGGGVRAFATNPPDRVVIDNTPVICPPFC
jgi:hypothetical protein